MGSSSTLEKNKNNIAQLFCAHEIIDMLIICLLSNFQISMLTNLIFLPYKYFKSTLSELC